MRRESPLFLGLYLLSMPAYCLIRLTGNGAFIAASTAVTAVCLFVFSLAHCAETRGARRSLLMLGSAFAIALTMEYMGSAYDVLFGSYDYTDLLGPMALGHVPVIIPIAWFMMLYPSWVVAGLLTARIAGRLTRRQGDKPRVQLVPWSPCLRVVLAALAMTAWDLSLDPRMAADGAWVWHDVPALNYAGIPLSNFAGWAVTSAMIYAAWTLVERGAWGVGRTKLSPRSTLHAILPIWAYVITWIGESMANALFWGGPGVAAWVFVGMGLFGAPALWLLIKGQLTLRAAVRPTTAH